MEEHGNVPYALNLDPAVTFVPYSCTDDIRNTINYKDVMRKHQLGPNGAIMTSLNIFAANFNKTVEKMEAEKDYKE